MKRSHHNQTWARACALTGAALAVFAGSAVEALSDDRVTFRDFPFLIYCNYEDIDHAYYFSRVGPDGVAIYLTPDRLAGTVTVDGVAKRIGGEQSGTCADKTIDELRSAGQAFDAR